MSSCLQALDTWKWRETGYDLSAEPVAASLLTTGNGYMGVRGSLEEFGSLRIQGCYVRGVADWIYDIRLPYCDNIYMKKYYFNEEELKRFEKQECVINLADFLYARVRIGGEDFLPWEGTLLSWERTLDIRENTLTRRVKWQNTQGDVTEFIFERFASFADDHVYCMRISVLPVNHCKPVEITSGIDLLTKTYGQHTTKGLRSSADNGRLLHEATAGDNLVRRGRRGRNAGRHTRMGMDRRRRSRADRGGGNRTACDPAKSGVGYGKGEKNGLIR